MFLGDKLNKSHYSGILYNIEILFYQQKMGILYIVENY